MGQKRGHSGLRGHGKGDILIYGTEKGTFWFTWARIPGAGGCIIRGKGDTGKGDILIYVGTHARRGRLYHPRWVGGTPDGQEAGRSFRGHSVR